MNWKWRERWLELKESTLQFEEKIKVLRERNINISSAPQNEVCQFLLLPNELLDFIIQYVAGGEDYRVNVKEARGLQRLALTSKKISFLVKSFRGESQPNVVDKAFFRHTRNLYQWHQNKVNNIKVKNSPEDIVAICLAFFLCRGQNFFNFNLCRTKKIK